MVSKVLAMLAVLVAMASLANAQYAPTAIVDLRGNDSATRSYSITLTWPAPSVSGWGGPRLLPDEPPVGALAAGAPAVPVGVPKDGIILGPSAEPVHSYQVGYSREEITVETWDDDSLVVKLAGPLPPKNPGVMETFKVTGLIPDTEYHFCVRSFSDDSLISPLSNIRTTRTHKDTIAPSTITTLNAIAGSDSTITLKWNAGSNDAGDNESGAAASYILRCWVPAPGASFATGTDIAMPAPADPDMTERVTIEGLVSATAYAFAIRLRDSAGNTSGLSNETAMVTAPPDTSTGDASMCSSSSTGLSAFLLGFTAMAALLIRR